MPIRLCQKCGLKVLIDESQAGTNPFYCQRCTTAMKGQEGAAPAPAMSPAKSAAPVPAPNMAGRSDPAAPSVPGAAKAATVRVLCPYCKASFNGRVPQKPARGSCPVCQKELILLPNGDIKPSAGFDLGQWQGEPGSAKPAEPALAPVGSEAKESGTRLLVKKYAAEPPPSAPEARPAASRDEPVTAPAETDVSDEAGALPGWLDDSNQGGGAPVRPQPDTDMAIDVVEPSKEEGEDQTIKVEDDPPPPPPPSLSARARSPIVAKNQSISSGKPPSALPPAPEVDLLPPDPPKKRVPSGEHRVPSGERRAPVPVPVAAEAGETGSGKVFLALILALLPVVACVGMLNSMDKLNNNLVKKVGERFVKGFAKLDQKLFPPPPPPKPKAEVKQPEPEPPPKEEPPKADPDQQKKDEIKISHLYTENLMKIRKLKELKKTETADQTAGIKKIEDDINGTEAQIKRLREDYLRMYGKEYDPTK